MTQHKDSTDVDLTKTLDPTQAKPHIGRSLHFARDITLTIRAQAGNCVLPIRQLLSLKSGAVIELPKEPQEPIELYMNDKLFARGEVVVVNDKYGIRITEIV